MARCPACHRRLPVGAACTRHPDATVPDTPPPEVLDVEPALDIPGYRGARPVGRGGFACVYAALDEQLDRDVAIKVILAGGDARVDREAAALARVGPPASPRLHGRGRLPGGQPYLIMDLVQGRALSDWMAGHADAAPPLDEALRVFQGVCKSVDSVHRAGVIHRDVKPENIVIGEAGATLLDFGLARAEDAGGDGPLATSLTRAGERIGTVHYMAPEQCRGDLGQRHLVDVYALGVIAFELLTGRPPFVGDPAAIQQGHLARRPPSLAEITRLPAAVDDVVARALAKNPEARFANARSLAAALDEAVRAPRVAAPSPARAQGTPVSTVRRGVALLAAHTQAPFQQVCAAIESLRGEVVRSGGGWYVAAFPHAPSTATSVRDALRSAARLEGLADRRVVHVVTARVRTRGARVSVFAAEIDRVESWAGRATAEHTLVLTREAAEHAHDTVEPAGEELFALTSHRALGGLTPSARVSLRGREAQIAALVRPAGRRPIRPTLATAIGDIGHGKSRFLREVAAELTGEGLTTVEIGPEDTGPRSLLRALATRFLELPDDFDAAAIDRAAAKLGAEPRGARALAHALGLGDRGEGVDAPGAARQAAAQLVALGIEARARDRALAIAVDDAHAGEPAALDALELVTLAERSAPVYVVATAAPTLDSLRPDWGDRAGESVRVELPPLDGDDTRALLLDLLYPVELIAEPILARLHEMTGGVPMHLVEIARILREEGSIRKLRSTDSFYLAADDLLHVSATPLAERAARKVRDSLPGQLWSLARACAALREFTVDELDAVQRRVSLSPDDLEPSAGAAMLVENGLLRRAGVRLQFRYPMVRDAIEVMIPADEHRALHAAAYDVLAASGATHDRLERLARHAEASGNAVSAAHAHLRLAEDARAAHDVVRAEQHFSSALALIGASDRDARETAHRGRAQVRYRQQKYAEARDDVVAARALAEERGDDRAAVELLLEEATICDWAHDFESSAQLAREAQARATQLGDSTLDARLLQAEARTLIRNEKIAESIPVNARAAELAAARGDYEARVGSMMLLAPSLCYVDRTDESEQRFDELLELCRDAGDLMHLAGAHSNRVILWLKRQDFRRAAVDARRAAALARQVGHATPEWIAQHNLSELLLWMNDLDGALAAAERARVLQERFASTPRALEALMLARIRTDRGEHESAMQHVGWIDTHVPDAELLPSQRILIRSVRLACRAAAPDEWLALVGDSATDSVLDEQLEIRLRAAASLADRAPETARRILDEGAAALGEPSPWRERFAGARVLLPSETHR